MCTQEELIIQEEDNQDNKEVVNKEDNKGNKDHKENKEIVADESTLLQVPFLLLRRGFALHIGCIMSHGVHAKLVTIIKCNHSHHQ